MLAVGTFRCGLRTTAFTTKLRARLHRCTTFHALRSRGGGRRLGGRRTALPHGITHRACHGATDGESGTKSCAQSSTAAGILRRIAHCLRCFELRVLAHVTEDAHRGAFIHRGFDFLRQGNIFNYELGEFETERLKFIL